jgi:hypothetical protein
VDDAMRSSFTRLAVCGCLLVGSWVAAQSLGEVAQKEEARRKAIKQPSKVYTNADLRGGGGSSTSAPAPATPAASQPSPAGAADGKSKTPGGDGKTTPQAATQPPAAPTPGATKDRDYWQKRIKDAQLEHERGKLYMDALQSRINALWTDFTARDNPLERAKIATDRQRALAELERLKKDSDTQQKAIAAIEEEARRAGVPAGWLR